MRNILFLFVIMISLPAISQQDSLKKDSKAQEGIKRKVVIERAPAPEKSEPANKFREENQRKEPKSKIPPVPPPVVELDENLSIEEEIIAFPEKRAEFPGGREALFKFINETMEYPEKSKEKGEQGKVYLTFVVEKSGMITNVKISRGVSEAIDKEAKRIIRKMPNWIPGENKGNTVRTLNSLPIVFLLK